MGVGTRGTAAIVDIDGTLVDSNYQHALAWFRAFRRHGVTCELWRLHRLIGMGGDQLVEAAAGAEVERVHGNGIRAAERTIFAGMIDEITVLPGARRLLEELSRRARAVVLSSSAKPEEADHYIRLLDARELLDDWTTSEDVEATKPAPDLVEVALAKAGGGPAVMIGDSTWDCIAAARAGVPTVALLTGGFGREELWEAGAIGVHSFLAEAIDQISAPGLLDGAPA